jgi:hypothetical protein
VALGRDEKDVGVRSLSCGVAGNQLGRQAVAAGAGWTHVACRNLNPFGGAPLRAALVQEWYNGQLQLSSIPYKSSRLTVQWRPGIRSPFIDPEES